MSLKFGQIYLAILGILAIVSLSNCQVADIRLQRDASKYLGFNTFGVPEDSTLADIELETNHFEEGITRKCYLNASVPFKTVHGTVIAFNEELCRFSYKPDQDYAGDDTFTFTEIVAVPVPDKTITESGDDKSVLDKGEIQVKLVVYPVNDAPVVEDQTIVGMNDLIKFSVEQITASDVDGDPLDLVILDPATQAVVGIYNSTNAEVKSVGIENNITMFEARSQATLMTFRMGVKDPSGVITPFNLSITNGIIVLPKDPAMLVSSEKDFTVLGGEAPLGVNTGIGGGSILALNPDGFKYKAPAVAGTYTLRVADYRGKSTSVDVRVFNALTVTPMTLNLVTGGVKNYAVAGGIGPYTVEATGGGTVSAITSTGFTYTAGSSAADVSIKVKDTVGNEVTTTVKVYPPLVVNPTAVTVAVTRTQIIDYSGGMGPFTFTLSPGVGTYDGNSKEYVAPATTTQNTVTMTVRDSIGNQASTIITIKNRGKVLSVTSDKANGAYTIGEVIPVKMTFTDDVTLAGGSPTLKLETDLNDPAVPLSSQPDAKTMIFNYTVMAGDNSLDLDYHLDSPFNLNGATLKDSSGLDVDIVLPRNASNKGLLAQNKDIVIDTLPPVATMTPMMSGYSSLNTLNVTVGTGPEVVSYRHKVGPAASTDCAVEAGYGTETLIATKITNAINGWGDVDLRLCVVGKDKAGNWQSFAAATVASWTRDSTMPIAVIYGAPTGLNNTTTLNITIGDGPEIVGYKYKVGVASSTDCASATGYSAEIALATKITQSISAIADGDVELCVVGKDWASNWQSYAAASIVTWTKKVNPSTAVIVSGAPTGVNRVSNLNIDIGGTGVVKYRYKLAINAVCTDPVGYGADIDVGLNITDSLLTDGVYKLCVVGKDALDQYQPFTTPTSAQWTRDTVIPSVTLTSTNTDPTNANVSVTATFNKSVSGFTTTDLVLTSTDGTNPTITTGSWPASGATYTFTMVKTCSGCTISVKVPANVVTDTTNDGQNTESNTLSRTIDKTAPTISLATTAPQYLPLDGSGVVIQFTVQATLSEAVVGFDAADVTLTSGQVLNFRATTPTLYEFEVNPTTEGTLSLTVTAGKFTDAANNANTASNMLSRMYDKTEPTVPSGLTLGTPNYANLTAVSPALSWTASYDAVSGVKEYQVQILKRPSDEVVIDWNTLVSGGKFSGLNLQSNAAFYYRIRAVDNAGNISQTTTSATFYTDSTPPSLPANFVDGMYAYSSTETSTAQWGPSTDALSGLRDYMIAIGTTAGGTNVLNWTSIGQVTTYSLTSTTLSTGTTYYTSIKAVDNYNNETAVVQGDGWVYNPICPPNFVLVPGDAAKKISSFCVSRYEMAKSGSTAIVSRGGTLFNNVTRKSANDACSALGTSLSKSLEIPSNAQYNVLAANVFNSSRNWSSGTVGAGIINSGHSDNDPAAAQVTGAETNPYLSTNNSAANTWGAGAEQKRTHTLSNQSVIWDLAGNLQEWVQDEYFGGTQMPSLNTDSWSEFDNLGLFPVGGNNRNTFVPTNLTVNSSMQVGQFYGARGGSILRGGVFSGLSQTGIFTASLKQDPSMGDTGIGFRCVTPNLSIKTDRCDNQVQVGQNITLTIVGGFPSYTVTASAGILANGATSNERILTAPNTIGPVTITITDSQGNQATLEIKVYDPTAASGTVTYCYTGSDQAFTIPSGVTQLTIKAWGAGGGSSAGGYGGGGAYVTGSFAVSSGAIYNIKVGNGGKAASPSSAAGGGGASGVFEPSNGQALVIAGAGGGSGNGSGAGGAGGAVNSTAEAGSRGPGCTSGCANGGQGGSPTLGGAGGASGSGYVGMSSGFGGNGYLLSIPGGNGCDVVSGINAYGGGGIGGPGGSGSAGGGGGGGGGGYTGGGGGGCGGQAAGGFWMPGAGGGGGSSFYPGAGVSNADSAAGAGVIPGKFDDADYTSGVGVGGVGGLQGGNGKVILNWN